VLPFLAAAFIQHYPHVQVTVEMCKCNSVVDRLLSRDVPLGISSTRVTHKDMGCQPFFTDRVVLVVPAEHPFASQSSVQPAELLDQPFILREESSSTRQLVEKGLSEHNISLDQLQIVMVVGNAEAIEVAIEHELGIAFISHLAASHGFELEKLVEVPVEGLQLERPLYMGRDSRCAKTPAQDQLWYFVREHRESIVDMLKG